MGFIINGIIKSIIDLVTRVLDIFFSATLGVLGVNLNVFEKVFPLVKKLNIAIITIALGIAFYIFIFQIIKNLNPASIDDAESPLSLLASFVTTVIVIVIYRPLLNILLSFTTGSLTILQSGKLTKILQKGLATSMYDTFFDSLTKRVYFSTSSNNFIIKNAAKAANTVANAANTAVDAALGNHMPERIAAVILVAYIYSKLYKIMKIIIRTYVGVGILTYIAPLPLATRASKTTKGYATNFIQIYIEHLVSILLNCWFLRIVFDGFGAVDFSSLSKMTYSMSGISKAIRSLTYATFFDKSYELFAVVFIWVLMIGAFIDYAVNLNVYIERMSGIGGLSMVPNSSHPSNPFKESPVSKAVSSAVGTAAGLAIGAPLHAMKRSVGKQVSDKIQDDFDKRNGIFKNVPKSSKDSDSEQTGTKDSNSGVNSSSADAAMGGSKGPNQESMGGKKDPMEPYSPAADDAKKAGMYSLLHKPLSGKDAKKQMAAAMNGKKGFMNPYGEGKEYLDKLKSGKSKEDQEKLDNSLVFDAGSDGMQIMSDIESDGNGKITASMNGEDIELFSGDAESPENLDSSVEIGGQTMSYDSSKCPTFHKMMGGIDLTGSAGAPDDDDFDLESHIYNPGKSQKYEDFVVGSDKSSAGPHSTPDIPKTGSDAINEFDVDESDIEF